jgi:putative nucleotidyltransferase with HDIG domain
MVSDLDPRVQLKLDAAIAGDALDVPALGEAVTRLLVECRKPDPDARRVAEIVRRDPALAGSLLNLANGATYAGREPAATLQQAVCRLGTTAMRDLALVIASRTKMFRVTGRDAEMRALFAHAFATAIYAQEIARIRRFGVEEAFLAGLFHDVGRPLVLQLAIDACGELGIAVDEAAIARAADELHAAAGARAVASWQLGPRLVDAVARHHDYDPAAREDRLAAIASVASALATIALAGGDPEAARHHAALAGLGLYPDDVDGLLALAPKVVAQVAEAT